jgi:hypothetical protein
MKIELLNENPTLIHYQPTKETEIARCIVLLNDSSAMHTITMTLYQLTRKTKEYILKKDPRSLAV